MAVKELPPFVWRTFAEGRVALSEEGAVATQIAEGFKFSLTTTGVELTEGKHYWEVELLSETGCGEIVDIDCYSFRSLILCVLVLDICIGISRPNLDPTGYFLEADCAEGWFMAARDATLCQPSAGGVGAEVAGGGGAVTGGGGELGDRVGVLLDLGDGSLRFFKNGAQHGPGYAEGSVTGPGVAAVQMFFRNDSVRLLPNAPQPE
jgi:hypothetical protein